MLFRSLDGLPLAIELAAARIKLLPPQTMLARLESRLKLLTGGARDLPARQQTLKAAMDWSYELLDTGEKTLFRRISVFVGGCSLEAAEAVSNAGGDLEVDLLDGLASLADKSLVRQQEQEKGKARILMLETIREYAMEGLNASGESEAVRHRHGGYYLAQAEAASEKLDGPEQSIWLDRLESEHDNLRAALDWLNKSSETEAALRLAGALWQFWEVRGYLAEGRQRLARVLSLAGASARSNAYMKALYAAGFLADVQGDYAAARAIFERNLAIHRQLGDKRAIAASTNNLGVVALRQGDYAAARALYEESLAIYREFGVKTAVASSLNNLGHLALCQSDYAAARSLYEESLAISRELGDWRNVAWSFNNLGDVAREEGDPQGARSLYEQSLERFKQFDDKAGIARCLCDLGNVACDGGDFAAARSLHQESLVIFGQLGDKQGIARVLEALVGLAAAQAEPERGLRLAGAACAVREALGAPLAPAERHRLERKLAGVRQALSEAAVTTAWAEGHSMTLERAMEYALQPD